MTESAQHVADVIVVGGGMAGVSVASELATDHSVILLEAEDGLGHHATGRSAAMFLATYGGPDVRALTLGSREFLTSPPDGFDAPLLSLLPLLQIALPGRGQVVQDLHDSVVGQVPEVRLIPGEELSSICPLLRDGAAELGLLEPKAMEIDVHALHQGYVRRMRERGATVVRRARVEALERSGGVWHARTPVGTFSAPLVVNAAGAWADQVAAMAGRSPIGLTPLRRTAFTVSGADVDAEVRRSTPLLYDVDESFYIKPEGDQFLCSPADRTPSEPCDAKPDELAIAQALERIQKVTVVPARSVRSAWAGLRTQSPDGNLVIGADPDLEGFFWCAGQGGYGIQSAPGVARLSAALVRSGSAPQDLLDLGLDPDRLAPARFPTASEH